MGCSAAAVHSGPVNLTLQCSCDLGYRRASLKSVPAGILTKGKCKCESLVWEGARGGPRVNKLRIELNLGRGDPRTGTTASRRHGAWGLAARHSRDAAGPLVTPAPQVCLQPDRTHRRVTVGQDPGGCGSTGCVSSARLPQDMGAEGSLAGPPAQPSPRPLTGTELRHAICQRHAPCPSLRPPSWPPRRLL